MFLFSVYDVKAEAYGKPFFIDSRGLALRSFSEVASDLTSEIGKYPSDFTLFELGSYDVRTGFFDLHKTPISLGVAIEFVSKVSK